jgi:hypothetical protein
MMIDRRKVREFFRYLPQRCSLMCSLGYCESPLVADISVPTADRMMLFIWIFIVLFLCYLYV